MRVWFNRSFSSVHTAIDLIRQADTAQRFTIIHSNPNPRTPAARLAHAFQVEPTGLATPDYIDWCVDFCRQHQVGIFIPGREATALAGCHARFEAVGTRVLSAASEEHLLLIHDKARFYAETVLPAAPVAEFRHFEDVAAFESAYDALRRRHAKLCVKPAHSIYGLGFAVLDEERNSAELLMAGAEYHVSLADFRAGLGKLGSFRSMLLMEFLEGREYSVDCVGDNGRLVSAVVRRKSGQAGAGQRIDQRADILDATARLCSTHGLNGIFNVQFREAAGAGSARRPRLLEINPRMSGGIGMACVAGPNLPYIALCGFADGYQGLEITPVRNGIRVAELARAVELA
jgi:carbamoylphosphate synthase large subunit